MEKIALKKKKTGNISREVINLLGSIPPMKPSLSKHLLTTLRTHPPPSLSASWEWSPFVSPGRPDSLQFHHWENKNSAEPDSSYSSYSTPIELIPLCLENYDFYSHPSDWTSEETQYFWGLCRQFELRFIIIEDQYDTVKYPPRSVEELKSRYYSLSRQILLAQGVTSHSIISTPFNPNYELKRKTLLEKYYLRTKEQQQEERKYLEEAKKLNAKIHKEEKELKNFEKLMTANSEEIELPEWNSGRKEPSASSFLNSFYLTQPELPTRLLGKIDAVLQETGISEKPMPTTEAIAAYDRLKKEILILIHLQKYLIKKETEKRNFEEKLNEVKSSFTHRHFVPEISIQMAGNTVKAAATNIKKQTLNTVESKWSSNEHSTPTKKAKKSN